MKSTKNGKSDAELKTMLSKVQTEIILAINELNKADSVRQIERKLNHCHVSIFKNVNKLENLGFVKTALGRKKRAVELTESGKALIPHLNAIK